MWSKLIQQNNMILYKNVDIWCGGHGIMIIFASEMNE